MKNLIFMGLARKSHLPQGSDRKLTIGFYLVSCDIYLHIRANSRRKNRKTPNKTAIRQAIDDLFYPDSLLRVNKKEHIPHIEILSLLKPGSDSYPGNFNCDLILLHGKAMR